MATKQSTKGGFTAWATGHKPQTVGIIVGCVVVIAAAAIAVGCAVNNASATGDAGDTAVEEVSILTPDGIASMATALEFNGTSLSVKSGSVAVEIKDGKAMVVESLDTVGKDDVLNTGLKAAALAHNLSGMLVQSNGDTDAHEVTSVTWVTTDATGTIVSAVTISEDNVPTAGTAAEVINGSQGHDMTADAYTAIGGSASGVTQKGGDAITAPSGMAITVGQTISVDKTTSDGSNVPTSQTVTTTTTTDTSNASTGSTSGASTASTDSTSSNSSSSANNDSSTSTQTWVVDQAAYDEQVWVSNVVTVVDSPETTTTVIRYVCSDGTVFEGENAAYESGMYSCHHGVSYYADPYTVTTPAVTHEEDQGYYTTVHHDEVGHWA